jgi:glycine cleavage system H protein
VEVNEQLADSPELINQSPYGDGWIYKVRLSDPDELDEMMDAAAYREFLASEAN